MLLEFIILFSIGIIKICKFSNDLITLNVSLLRGSTYQGYQWCHLFNPIGIRNSCAFQLTQVLKEFSMCTVNDAEFEAGEEFMQRDEAMVMDTPTCKKCKDKEAEVVLRVRDAYCRTCFLSAATHKFRATLGKSKIVRPTDTILVGHSGKAGSTALLHLMKAGMSEAVHKRLMFKSTVLYIDEGAITGQTLEQRQTTITDIADQVKDLGFPGYTVSLYESLRESELDIQPLDSYVLSTEGDEVLINLFDALPSYTSKEEMLHKLRQRLLVATARKLNCCKIFVADGATDLAIRILSNISVGRGAQLPLDVGFTDSRHPGLLMLRPMRDFTRKELAYYLNFHDLKVIQTPGMTTKKDPHISIQKLTEKFVTELNTEFSGTVSTVFRTSEKLGTEDYSRIGHCEEKCVLCEASLDTSFSETSALQATNFSRLVSSEGPNGRLDSESLKIKVENNRILEESTADTNGCGSCDNCGCGKNGENQGISLEDLEKCLCYGCRLVFRDSNTQNSIPTFIKSAVRQRLSLDNMRREIADFLL